MGGKETRRRPEEWEGRRESEAGGMGGKEAREGKEGEWEGRRECMCNCNCGCVCNSKH